MFYSDLLIILLRCEYINYRDIIKMVVESSPKLNLVVNGEITDSGKLARELVNSDLLLRNNADPEVLFAMSPKMQEDHQNRKENHLQTLGITEEIIPDLKAELDNYEAFATTKFFPSETGATPLFNGYVSEIK